MIRREIGGGRRVGAVLMIPGIAGLLSLYGLAGGPGLSTSGANQGGGGPAPGAAPLDFALYRERVEPIFLNERGGVWGVGGACVTCHTWQTGTPFRLQPLEEDANGRVFWTEEQSRMNFLAAARLVVPGFPEQSRLLNKPLDEDAGGAEFHTGGTFWASREDPEWQAIADWVRSGDERPEGAEPPPPVSLDFEFFRSCVQPIFVNPIEGALPCTSCHGSGVRGFARPIPEGRNDWTEEESRQNFTVLQRFIAPGDPLGSRFLMHPLHPEGGGSYMHNGGRRWTSQEDPEWRMLAEWIRGERTGTSCS